MKGNGRVVVMVLGILLSAVLLQSACAHARHLAVVADAAFAKTVFALDDAELDACQKHVLTQAQCDAANPKIKQALLDVRAVTASLQATPKNVAVPKSLPDLLTDLTQVQAILAPAAANGGPAALVATRATDAINQTIAIVRMFTQAAGGK